MEGDGWRRRRRRRRRRRKNMQRVRDYCCVGRRCGCDLKSRFANADIVNIYIKLIVEY